MLFLEFPGGNAETLGEAAGEIAGRVEPGFEKHLGYRFRWVCRNGVMRFQKPEFLQTIVGRPTRHLFQNTE